MKRWIKRISALALSAVLLAERPRFPPERRQGGFRDVSDGLLRRRGGVGGGAWRHRRHLGHHFLPRGHRHPGPGSDLPVAPPPAGLSPVQHLPL